MDILIEAISFPLRGGSRSSRRSPSSTGARAAAAPARAVSRDINQLSWKYSICKVITSTLLLSMSPYIATLLGGVVSGTVGSATTTAISFATIITQYAFSSISSIARAAFTTDGLTLCSIIGLGQIASAWSELALTPSERFSTITHIREVWERRGSLATSSIMCVFNKNIEVFARAYRFMEANSNEIVQEAVRFANTILSDTRRLPFVINDYIALVLLSKLEIHSSSIRNPGNEPIPLNQMIMQINQELQLNLDGPHDAAGAIESMGGIMGDLTHREMERVRSLEQESDSGSGLEPEPQPEPIAAAAAAASLLTLSDQGGNVSNSLGLPSIPGSLTGIASPRRRAAKRSRSDSRGSVNTKKRNKR